MLKDLVLQTPRWPWLAVFVAILTLAHPASAALFGSSSTILFITGLMGLLVLRLPAQRVLSSEEKILASILLAFFIVSSLSFLLAGYNDLGFKKLGRYFRFVFLLPLMLLLIRFGIKQSTFYYGVVIGSIATGIWAVSSYLVADSLGYRVTGNTNPILFGGISLVNGFISLAAAQYFRQHALKSSQYLALLAAVCGLTASILSGSRGAWLFIPTGMLVMLWSISRDWGVMQKIYGFCVMCLLVAAVIFSPQVQHRMQQAQNDVQQYMADEIKTTSSGMRFEMWLAAWTVFNEHPVLGIGVGRYNDGVVEQIAAGKRIAEIQQFNHPHNEYLLTLASRGLLGFIALLAVFFYPLWWFGKSAYAKTPNSHLGMAGIFLVLGYMHFGLTEAIFDRGLSISYFVIQLGFLMYLTVQANIKNKQVADAE